EVILLNEPGVLGRKLAREGLTNQLALARGEVQEGAVAADVVHLGLAVGDLAVGDAVARALLHVLFLGLALLPFVLGEPLALSLTLPLLRLALALSLRLTLSLRLSLGLSLLSRHGRGGGGRGLAGLHLRLTHLRQGGVHLL